MRTVSGYLRGSWLLPLAAAAAVFGVVWGTLGASALSGSYTATLSGDAEVPALATPYGGSFSATLSGDSLSYSLTSDAVGTTQAHIHLGAADENGGVVAFLFGLVEDGVNGVDTSGTIQAADVIGAIEGDFNALIDAMNASGAYVNLHSLANPGGEVRGQIALAAAALPSTGSGGLAQSDGSGAWVWALIAAGMTLALGLTARQAVRRRF